MKRTISKKIIITSLLLLLLFCAGNAHAAYDLVLNNLPSTINAGGGSFMFDVYLANPTEPFLGWSFHLDIAGREGQDYVDFNYTTSMANSINDSNYIFYGNSFEYQLAHVSTDTNSITGSDLTDDLSTMSTGGFLARVTVDYDASAYGTYNITAGGSLFNHLVDASWNESYGVTEDELLGVVSVVPEPVSSLLFITGAVTLGLRRFRKNRTK